MHSELSQIHVAHRSLRQLARYLRECGEQDVAQAYMEVLRATEHAFHAEHRLMEAFDFPARQCHLEQHARVLRALHCLHPAVMLGAHHPARHAGGQLLMDWFHLHNTTLDAALAVWVGHCAPTLTDQSEIPPDWYR